MLGCKCLSRRASPLSMLIELVTIRASSSLTNELLSRFTLHPPGFLVSKQKVVCRMIRSLSPTSPILILKLNGWRLVPNLQHVIIMLDLQQKREFDLMAFCLNDALHLFRGIPDGHVASTSSWRSTRRRIANLSQQSLCLFGKFYPTKVREESNAIQRSCHGLLPSQSTLAQVSFPEA